MNMSLIAGFKDRITQVLNTALELLELRSEAQQFDKVNLLRWIFVVLWEILLNVSYKIMTVVFQNGCIGM